MGWWWCQVDGDGRFCSGKSEHYLRCIQFRWFLLGTHKSINHLGKTPLKFTSKLRIFQHHRCGIDLCKIAINWKPQFSHKSGLHGISLWFRPFYPRFSSLDVQVGHNSPSSSLAESPLIHWKGSCRRFLIKIGTLKALCQCRASSWLQQA